ncbi:hypothetical protein JOC73_001317 [Alkaliphilus hydrothermalis]|uniref:SLH domain-containing protein n=2 Tax=Alkaliphilus hydrothermalis TaxID=1482730 RepID=A0ABS2NPD1_9FIRM|nr:hypothetical protein [Alkaliphilus hydrothermalis]
MSAGERLEVMGLLKGDNGDLMLTQNLKRQEMIVMLARLLGQEEEAENYPLATNFTDVRGDYYGAVIGWAQAEGYTTGLGDGTFGFDQELTVAQTITFLLRALGYETTYAWDNRATLAVELGFVAEGADLTAKAARGFMAELTVAALYMTPVDGETALGTVLGYDGFEPVVEEPVVLAVKSVNSISQTTVHVGLEEAITVAPASTEFVVKDAAGTEVAVTSTGLKTAGEVVVLTTDEMSANAVYTLTYNGVDYKFVTIANETTKPQLTSAVALTNTTVKVTFTENVDENALNIANYAIEGLQILAAEYDVDVNNSPIKTSIVLTTATQTQGTIYKLVVTNVTDMVGNVINADNDEAQFGGLAADTTKPQLTSAVALTNTTIQLTFNENMDELTAENIANYAIEGLQILSAERQTNKAVVVLTTVEQTQGTIYKVVVTNVTDASGNIINADNDEAQFGGLAADTTKPQLASAVGLTNTSVRLTFNENMNKETIENIANYAIEGLTVVAAKQDSTNKAIVELTTSAQVQGTIYKVVVTNVTDVSGNVINTDNDEFSFGGLATDTTKPTVVSAVAGSATTVKVTFSEIMDDVTAKQAYNYYLGTELGYPSAVAKDTVVTNGTVWVLTTKTQESKVYTVDVTGIKDKSGNVVDEDNDTATFGGLGTADTTAPKVSSAVALNKQEIKITFNEKIDAATVANTDFAFAVLSGTETATTRVGVVGTPDAVVVASDKMSATVAFQTAELTSGVIYRVTVATINDANGVAIAAANHTADFAGINAANEAPKVTSIIAIDNRTLKVTFSEKVTGAQNLVFADFNFSPAYAGALNDAVLATDGMSATYYFDNSATFTAGTVYTVQILNTGVAKITDQFALDTLATKTGQTYAEANFAGVSSAPAAVKIAAVTAVDTNTIDITFNKEIGLNSTINTGLIEAINLSNGSVFNNSTIQLVRLEGTDNNKVRVFFDVDNTLFTAGNLYQVKLVEAQIVDNNGTAMLAANDSAVFAAVSTANPAPKMVNASHATATTVKVTFSEAIVLNDSFNHFTLSAGNVTAASVSADGKTVTLTVDSLPAQGTLVTVTAAATAGPADITDEAGVANTDYTKTVQFVVQ